MKLLQEADALPERSVLVPGTWERYLQSQSADMDYIICVRTIP